MDKLSMCRICLVEDVKMYSLISANLQDLYERLTKMPFETKDKRPVQVCYLCCARLQNCYRLQAVCLKSEEFFNNVIVDSELNEMELQDLNTLKTVHPLVLISCVPSTRKHPEDNKIDEDNDFKFDPSEIASDVQVKHELFEDDSCTDEEVHIKSEVTVEEEDICAKYGDLSDNRHTMQNIELEHNIQLKTAKIVLERIDLEAFKIGGFVDKKPQSDLPHGNTESTISTKPEIVVTVVQNNSFAEKIQTMEGPAIVNNIYSVEQLSFITKKHIKIKNIELSSDMGDNSIKVHRCVVCENSFSGKRELLRHTRTHTGEKPYRCKICEKSFSQNSSLVIHTRRHTGDKPYRCNVCEKSFVAKNALQVHSRVHTGEKPSRVHTGEKPYSCKICEKSFSRSDYLISHIRIHTHNKSYHCKICEKSFSRSDSLVSHTRIHTGIKPYRCKICEKSFSRSGTLLNHTRIHTGDKPYRCKICEKSFSQNNSLIIHTRTHTGARPYTCDVCKQSFNLKSSLFKHSRVHTGEKPYRCEICEKSFSHSSVLIIHIRRHTGEKPYRCNVCEKSFVARSRLLTHSRVHTGEKPYSCKICEKKFSWKESLEIHTLTHSAERPYICDICQKSFSARSYLIKHIHRHMQSH